MMTLGKTNRGWRLLLLVCLAAAPSVYAVENGGRVVGEAHDLESDELLYREIYCANGNPDEMEVIYRDEAGGLIARKVLDYGSGATTPSFVQRNLYSSEIIEVKLQDSKVSMTVLDAVNSEPKRTSSTQTDGKLPVVIDAGWPPAITRPKPTSASNWSCLTGLSACW
jgi:hypothetical protein